MDYLETPNIADIRVITQTHRLRKHKKTATWKIHFPYINDIKHITFVYYIFEAVCY